MALLDEKLITGFNAGKSFKILSQIGQGAFGSIYDCVEQSGEDLPQLVVKIVKSNTSVKEMKILQILENNIEDNVFPKAIDFGILPLAITQSMKIDP